MCNQDKCVLSKQTFVVCVCVLRGGGLCNLVGVYFTDTVNSANKSQMNYNNSSHDLVVTKKV